MATSSPVEVCNIALKRLGADAIVAFDEGSSAASLCEQLYQPTVDALLREHTWNFAQIRVALAARVEGPAWGYPFAYTYPTKPLCLRVNAVEPPDAQYDIENTVDDTGEILGKIIASDTDSLKIRYTGRITDVTQWDASFTNAVAMSLAKQMAYPLVENAGLAKVVGEEYIRALQHARSVDSQEGSTKQADINTLVDVRTHGFRDDFNRNWRVI